MKDLLEILERQHPAELIRNAIGIGALCVMAWSLLVVLP